MLKDIDCEPILSMTFDIRPGFRKTLSDSIFKMINDAYLKAIEEKSFENYLLEKLDVDVRKMYQKVILS